jgi:hypothetical protein
MFEEPRGVGTQHTTSYEVVTLCPAQGGSEMTPSSNKVTTSDIVAHSAQEGIKVVNKQHKQCLQGTMTAISRNDDHDWEVGSSGMGCCSTTTRKNKHPTRPPTDHFKRLLEESYPNHAYAIRHKLKDCGMMRNFMTSGTLTWGTELDEGTNGSNTTPFPEDNTITTVYGGCPPCRA